MHPRFAAAVLVSGCMALAAPAHGDHPGAAAARAGPTKLVASKGEGLPGTLVRVVGRRFPRAKRVRLLLGGRLLKRLRTGRRGGFRTKFTVPERAPGTYRLVARARRKRLRLRFTILARAIPAATPAPAPEPAQPPPPPPPDPITLVAAGDIACSPAQMPETETKCRHARTAELVTALAPDAVATLGDAQYEIGALADYQTMYDPTWGAFKAITHPATGNHEYQGDPERDSAPGHFGYFGAAAGDPPKGYYRWELGGWTLFALNSGAIDYTRPGGLNPDLPDDCWPVSCAAGNAQEAWLRAELEALPAEACVIAYWHHPRLSSGWGGITRDYPEMAPVYDALYDNGAELALSGHAHNYERFEPIDASGAADPAGVRQFIVGTGGRNLFNDPGALHATSELLVTDRFGVLELTLEPQAYSFRFVAEDGTVVDQGSGGCHGPPA